MMIDDQFTHIRCCCGLHLYVTKGETHATRRCMLTRVPIVISALKPHEVTWWAELPAHVPVGAAVLANVRSTLTGRARAERECNTLSRAIGLWISTNPSALISLMYLERGKTY